MTASLQVDRRPEVLTAGTGPGYMSVPGSFDETVSPEGGIREHWRSFFDQMDAIGLAELRRRWEEAKHLIREHGVTYNVYGDPRGMVRPWELDPIPLLIDPAGFARIERGLEQRARLLDLILADLYGPQRLLAESAIPPELVFGHPGFLRPCHGINVPGGRRLHLVAADVAHAADGSFVVLRDRCQAPSGAGYALENRIVLSRMLPETFRDCRVHRLAPFFQALRDSLRAIAPGRPDNPRVVLLTPGPYNETYFEHAFLARYLGYTLVEGADLTVRDNRVYLKLLGGLQQVDVILRRIDDDYCDPLELRGDSFLGVPGLVQVVRSGKVAIANALGSGLIESPALHAYLPALARKLLGEELTLRTVPTWWCGDPVSREHVLANLGRMVVKPAMPNTRTSPVFGETLTPDQLRELANTIRSRPNEFVGQEPVRLSTAPGLTGDRLRPRHLVLRVFAAASGDSYTVMPGGLTRVSTSESGLVVSMQAGAGSKDTWVLSDGPVADFSLLPSQVQPVALSRGGGDLPSRAADDLYWLGRYAERAEGAVRLLRGVFVRLTEKSGIVDVPELPILLRALTHLTGTYPGFIGEGAAARLEAPLGELFGVFEDGRRAGSLAATLENLYRVASRLRDRLSTDMWRILSTLALPHRGRDGLAAADRDPLARGALTNALDRLDSKVITLAAFGGLATEGMTRGQGWRFLDTGRRIERSLQTFSLLRGTLVQVPAGVPEGPLLDAILEIADSAMTFRRRYLGSIHTAPVLDLLLADDNNPRSVAYQFAAIAGALKGLPESEESDEVPRCREHLGHALQRLRTADIARLAHPGPDGKRAALEEFLIGLQAELPRLSDVLTRSYLTHLQASRQYASRSA